MKLDPRFVLMPLFNMLIVWCGTLSAYRPIHSLAEYTHTHTLNLRESTQNHSIKLDTSAEKEPIEMFFVLQTMAAKGKSRREKANVALGNYSSFKDNHIKAPDSKSELRKKKKTI